MNLCTAPCPSSMTSTSFSRVSPTLARHRKHTTASNALRPRTAFLSGENFTALKAVLPRRVVEPKAKAASCSMVEVCNRHPCVFGSGPKRRHDLSMVSSGFPRHAVPERV